MGGRAKGPPMGMAMGGGSGPPPSLGPGSARFTSTYLPCSWCRAAMHAFADSSSANVTKPKPRLLLVARSIMTMLSVNAPYCSKWRRKSGSRTEDGSPPTKNLREARPWPPYSAAGAMGSGGTGVSTGGAMGIGMPGSVGGGRPSMGPSAVFTRGGGAAPVLSAGLMSIWRPSMWCGRARTACACSPVRKETKPKPRETPVALLRMTAVSVTSPNWEK
mmetsp:Transcript_29563/g.88397  ORF Transcript_29563/g.88397 Transcript_29563/m.88397 type:complete len:218 (+) Transcript_29563:1-654(+)